MSGESANALGLQLRRTAGLHGRTATTDGELVSQFLASRDETAFTELVRRHGPMVLAVCRRVAGHAHDAEDAFQATFLVLARKAQGLNHDVRLGAWLHAVAHRAALKAREASVRRRRRESNAARPEGIAAPDEQTDVVAVIEQELGRLPEKYRQPLVLCGLCGQSRQDVAAQLGIHEGTLASRLAKGREILAHRLHRRGLVVPAATVALACEPGGSTAAIPDALLKTTATAACGIPSAAVNQIATEVTRAMILKKLLSGLVVLAAVTAVTAGGFLTLSGAAANTTEPHTEPIVKAEPPKPAVRVEKPDPPGTVGPAVAGEPKWKAEFRADYGLRVQQTVKLIPSPFPASRVGYYDFVDSSDEGRVPPERMLMALAVDGPRILLWARASRYWTNRQPGGDAAGWPIRKYLEHGLGILEQEIEGDKSLLEAIIDADIVIRRRADEKQMAKDLQTELREKFGIAIQFEIRQEEREVVIATGKYTLKRGEKDEFPTVDIYAETVLEEPSSNHYSGTEKMLAHLGEFINRRVIDKTDPKSRDIALKHRYHQRRPATPETIAADTNPEKVLKNVADQTGLTFKTEKRKVRVLFVEKGEK